MKVICFFSLGTFSQVTIYSHDFDDIVGFSSDEAFCNATSCSSSDNKYGTQTNPSCVTGFTGTTFYARDINSCGSNGSEILVFPTSSVTPSGLITFSAKVGFDNYGINFSGTNSLLKEDILNKPDLMVTQVSIGTIQSLQLLTQV